MTEPVSGASEAPTGRDLALLSDWLSQTAEIDRLTGRFDALAAVVRSGVIVFTRERTLFANDRIERLLGVPAEMVPTTPLQRFFPDPEVRRRIGETLRHAWEGHAADLGSVVVTRGDGATRSVNIALRYLPRELEPTLLALIDDSTREATREATPPTDEHDPLRAFGLYLTQLANDLRGPLTAYLGHLEALTKRADLPADLREAFSLYRHVTAETLQRFGRAMEWGRHRPLSERVDLRVVVDRAVSALEAEGVSRDIHVDLDLDSVPAVPGISDQLQLAVEHVLRNAAEALAKRGGNIYVKVRAEGRRVELTVKDDGPGIPDSIFPHVFEPFSSTKSIASGMGLGLAIVKDIVTRHRGEVSIESAGIGTTVGFTLYAIEEERKTERAGRKRVLMVDDDTDLQETYCLLLERAGYEVLTATDAHQALDTIAIDPVDAIVVDVQMAGQDGIALVEAIATWHPQLLSRTTLHTAYAYEDRVRAVAEQHGIQVLQKPCPFSQFLQTLQQLLREDSPR